MLLSLKPWIFTWLVPAVSPPGIEFSVIEMVGFVTLAAVTLFVGLLVDVFHMKQ